MNRPATALTVAARALTRLPTFLGSGVRASRSLARSPSRSLLLLPAALLALAAPALAAEGGPPEGSTQEPSSTGTATSSTTAPTPPTTATSETTTAATSTATGSATTTTTVSASAPEPTVRAQAPQGATRPLQRHTQVKHQKPPHAGGGTAAGKPGAKTLTHVRAPSPSALTPPSPFALGSSFTGAPALFIANFNIPPFLLPIYQAAGSAYGIPWQVLAAINEVETDYGRDLALSSAGAEGWMQFLPSSWAQYGVDASGNGYADPYNPADAIFAAARYLRAAGGARHIRTAVFAYNHSQSYVESVMLRAQLLRATPAPLLQSLTALAEARFPVHAPSRFADGFPAVAGHPGRSLVATVVYSRMAAPVIAVQDGVIAAIGESAALGHYVVLRDAYGDRYTYGHLGSVATLYPVLSPRRRRPRRASSARAATAHGGSDTSDASVRRIPLPAASAGVQPRSPLTLAAVSSGLAFGAAAALESIPPPPSPATLAATALRSRLARHRAARARVFDFGHEEVHLQPLRVGAHVIAGTVLGHLAAAAASPAEGELIFQIRPAGADAPLIDPKPILDAWVSLDDSLAFRVVGKHRFPAAAPTAATTHTAATTPTTATAGQHKPPQPAFAAADSATAGSELTPSQWLQLIDRLGAIPDPVVQSAPSSAALPGVVQAGTGEEGQAEGQANGYH
jgi:Transglycosylase SLT domain